MTIEEMKARKIELGYTNEDLSVKSGVPLSTINKIFGGITRSPRKENILALESVLKTSEKKTTYSFNPEITDADIFSDNLMEYFAGTSAANKHQGEYTVDDYYALPEDIRAELIDGVLYYVASPKIDHQFIATQMSYQLMKYVDEKKGPCKPVLAPLDVQLDKDDKTILQPDVMILCKPEILVKNGRVFGAPDFVAEILSPSTKRRDSTLKLAKYSNAGVREYWIIDPQKRQVLVYDLENEEFPKLYGFADKIPVLIWNSELFIDFKDIYDYVKDYLD